MNAALMCEPNQTVYTTKTNDNSAVNPINNNLKHDALTNTLFQKLINQNDNINAEKADKSSSSEDMSTEKWLPPNLKHQSDLYPSCSRELELVPDHNSVDSINHNHPDEQNDNDVDIDIVGIDGTRKRNKVDKIFKKDLSEGKSLKPIPCKINCQNRCVYKFTEEERQNIFNKFWQLEDRFRRKDFLLKCVVVENVTRKRIKGPSRRKKTKKYFINSGSRREVVCQQYLLKTLDITQSFLTYTIDTKSQIGSSKKDYWGKRRSHNKYSTEIMDNLDKFIQKQIPTVNSLNCTASTTKKYFPTGYYNIRRLFMVYREQCDDDGVDHAGIHTFKFIFSKKYFISF